MRPRLDPTSIDFTQGVGWAPDAPLLMPNKLTECQNVKPVPGGYQLTSVFNGLSTDAANAAIKGGTCVRNSSNTRSFVFGTATKLYDSADADTITDRSDTAYSLPSFSTWEFAQWNDFIIATQLGDAPRYKTIGAAANFAAMGTNIPKAKHIGVVGDFVVLGNVNDGTAYPNRIHWGPIGDPEGDWATSAVTQADFTDLPGDGGPVTGIVGLQSGGLVFQEKRVWLMTYVGGDVVFSLQPVEEARGCVVPYAAVSVGSKVFYLAHDGFWMYEGGQSTPIGKGRVNDYYKSTILGANPALGQHLIQGVSDPHHTIVVWTDDMASSAADFIAYDYELDKWFYLKHSLGVTSLFKNCVQLTTPIGSNRPLYLIGGYSINNKLMYTNAAPAATAAGIITTGEFRLGNGDEVADITRFRPLINATDDTLGENASSPTIVVRIHRRFTQRAAHTSSAITVETSGFSYPCRINGRFFKIEMILYGDYVHEVGGVDILSANLSGLR